MRDFELKQILEEIAEGSPIDFQVHPPYRKSIDHRGFATYGRQFDKTYQAKGARILVEVGLGVKEDRGEKEFSLVTPSEQEDYQIKLREWNSKMDAWKERLEGIQREKPFENGARFIFPQTQETSDYLKARLKGFMGIKGQLVDYNEDVNLTTARLEKVIVEYSRSYLSKFVSPEWMKFIEILTKRYNVEIDGDLFSKTITKFEEREKLKIEIKSVLGAGNALERAVQGSANNLVASYLDR